MISKTGLFFLGFAVLLSACAKQQFEPKSSAAVQAAPQDSDIVGGSELVVGDLTSQSIVAVYDTKEKALCTGSIISANLILTAGHCFPKDLRAVVILFGNDISKTAKIPQIVRKVVDGRLHPTFAKRLKMTDSEKALNPLDWGDVSVLKFEGGLPAGYAPAQLLPSSYRLKDGDSVIAAGYGDFDDKSHLANGHLRKTTVKIIDANLGMTEVALDQRGGQGICQGDSGGPLYISQGSRLLLFGVVSRTYSRNPKSLCTEFSISTNVTQQLDWLKSAVRSLSSGGN